MRDRTGRESALEDDVRVVERYGEAHPDVWCGVMVEQGPTVRLVTAFTHDVDRHAAELRKLVAVPERLTVRTHKYSKLELKRLTAEVGKRVFHHGGPGREMWTTLERAHLVLRADQQELAAELLGQYGDALELTVGLFRYPPELVTPDRRVRECRLPDLTTEMARLEATVALSSDTVAPGEDGEGTVVVRNHGPKRTIETGPYLQGRVVRRGTDEVVGVHAPGAVDAVLRTYPMDPGQESPILLRFGTTSVSLDIGYALPPGQYGVRACLSVRQDGPRDWTPLVDFVSPEAPLTVR